MRMAIFPVAVLLACVAPVAQAQQPSKATGDSIGHPPPLPGPPPISEPSSKAQPAPAEPAAKGYTGAYAPAGTPPTPYSTGPLPQVDSGPGLDVAGPNNSTKSVKAVPCTTAARETDGTTTCIGITDQSPRRQRR